MAILVALAVGGAIGWLMVIYLNRVDVHPALFVLAVFSSWWSRRP